MRVNTAAQVKERTHEGAPAPVVNAEKQLRRSVMACMLWEDTFYESGEDIAGRIKALVPKVSFEAVASMAVEAREKMKLRHAPLLLARELARLGAGRKMGDLLVRVIQRPDEITEFLAMYWKEGRRPLAKQVKVGLARAFAKFEEHNLAKYDRDDAVKLRDALFLSHAKPADAGAAHTKRERKDGAKAPTALGQLYERIAARTLATPDTWEVQLSAGENKKETFERLIRERKLGALALLRNLRNMKEAGVDEDVIRAYLQTVNLGRVLPFRFVAAARYAPHLEPDLEAAMFRCLEGAEKLAGKTAIVVDNSGSMNADLSGKSQMKRVDAACGLAILARELCERCLVIGFGSDAAIIPARRGFALRDAILTGPGGGTYTDKALALAEREGYDRIILITDEQSHEAIRSPLGKGYVVNVGSYKNGIGYGKWTHIDGWSEAVLDYVRASEEA